MLPVVRIYLKEVGNQLSASTKLLGRAEALKRKGSLGLKWHEMKDAAGIQEACQTVQGMSYLAAVAKPPICETNHDCVSSPFHSPQRGLLYPTNPCRAQVCQTPARLLCWTSGSPPVDVLHLTLPRTSTFGVRYRHPECGQGEC
jgi:hypothetical protein